jgi:hypothetical protein
MDPRIERAQQLYWEITRLTDLGAHRKRHSKLIEMAQVHEERALELLEEGDPDGWVDLFAAVTAWAKAGCREDANRLVSAGRSTASQFGSGEATIHDQLDELEEWADELTTVPSLRDYDRPLPNLRLEAALA